MENRSKAVGPYGEEQLEKEYGRVTHLFTITQVPFGFEPEAIRNQWVGVPVPVREHLLSLGQGLGYSVDFFESHAGQPHPAAVHIVIQDAVVALLNQGRSEAATYLGSRFHPRFVLAFREREGELTQQ